MTKPAKSYLIPHDAAGGILHYTAYEGDRFYHEGAQKREIDWRPAEPFYAVLQLDHVTSGRSAVTFWWRNAVEPGRYPMGLTQFNKIIDKAEWQGPLLIDGLWRPVKRGSNYLIEYVPTEEAP